MEATPDLDDDSQSSEIKSYMDGLTDRQRRFVEEYCVDFNATAAAKRAGYSEHTAHVQGSQNLAKLSIRAAIDAYLDELSMTTSEAIHKLTRWGRGTIEPFVTDVGDLDLSSDSARQHLHLIRKSKITRRIERDPVGMPVADIITTEIELHDPKDAVKTILQIRGKLVEKHEHSGPDGGPIRTDVNQSRTWLIEDNTAGNPVPEPDELY